MAPTKDQWDIVMALVDRMSPALVSQFLLFVEGRANSDWVDEVAQAIEDSDLNRVAELILPQSMLDKFAPELSKAVLFVNDEFGTAMAKELKPLKPVIGPPVEFRFDVLDDKVIGMVQRQSSTLLKDFKGTAKAGIRQYILDGMRRQISPKEVAAAMFKDKVIGLSARGAQAVANYRAMLEGTDRKSVLSGALQRELRDRRFDSVVSSAMANSAKLPKAKIDQMVKAYSDRMLRHELKTLATTETLQAHEAVKQHLWLDAVTRGYIDPKRYVKKWYVAKDERTCKVCTAIAALNPNGVPINGLFKTPTGLPPLAGPLAHPNCRCITLVTAAK